MQLIDFYIGFNLAGLIFGLGAALVILFLGLFSLNSNYWFRTLNGTDKITIPMLWFGSLMLLVAFILNTQIPEQTSVSLPLKLLLLIILSLNGSYLTFKFAPLIRKEEKSETFTFLKLQPPHKYLIFIAGSISAFTWTAHAVILWVEIMNLIK